MLLLSAQQLGILAMFYPLGQLAAKSDLALLLMLKALLPDQFGRCMGQQGLFRSVTPTEQSIHGVR